MDGLIPGQGEHNTHATRGRIAQRKEDEIRHLKKTTKKEKSLRVNVNSLMNPNHGVTMIC